MPIPQHVIERVRRAQAAAAHDDGSQVRVVAGPGTGKSRAIEERVRYLLADQHVDPEALYVVSFTNASVRDLVDRIAPYCSQHGVDASGVSTTTLHSLALRLLRKGRYLAKYPVEPLVLDDWETRRLVDEEYSEQHGHGLRRAASVRRDFEALANRGQSLAWFEQPEQPVTTTERAAFKSFMEARRSLYAGVLPGELVRACVENIEAGSLDPVELLGIGHLIVDEYQDLNAADVRFIDHLIEADATVHVCGDDDQSLYSFRDAYPAGIQTFTARHPRTSQHTLEDCFRCTPEILHTATTLVENYAAPGRIEKHHRSLWSEAEPPAQGNVHRWMFRSDRGEADAIADSCGKLRAVGIDYDDIFILLADQNAQSEALYQAFEKAGIPVVYARDDTFVDTEPGRAVQALLRIACRGDDLVAHRVLFGLMRKVGHGTCCDLVTHAITVAVPPKQVFASGHEDVMPARISRSLTKLANSVAPVYEWEPNDRLCERRDEAAIILGELAGHHGAADAWCDAIGQLPDDMTLREVRDYLSATTHQRAGRILDSVYERLGLEVPDDLQPPHGVRFMSIHGAKGLDAQVVFVPGIEQEILPGRKREGQPSQVGEAARMLYVAITRAKAACMLSCAEYRQKYGNNAQTTPSEFLPHLNGRFEKRRDATAKVGLTETDAKAIAGTRRAMRRPSSS